MRCPSGLRLFVPVRKEPFEHLQQDQHRGGDQNETSVGVSLVEHHQQRRTDEQPDQYDHVGYPPADRLDRPDEQRVVVEPDVVLDLALFEFVEYLASVKLRIKPT